MIRIIQDGIFTSGVTGKEQSRTFVYQNEQREKAIRDALWLCDTYNLDLYEFGSGLQTELICSEKTWRVKDD